MNFELKDGRELCWDFDLVEKAENVELIMHKPTRKNTVITLDKPWEGNCCGYFSLLKLDGKFRLYCRACNSVLYPGHKKTGERVVGSLCVYESDDGKTFHRLPVNRVEFNGSTDNNICWRTGQYWDNMCVYYDENPDCPPDAKFKMVGLNGLDQVPGASLSFYKSADGLSFELVEVLKLNGSFDSFNVPFWDETEKEYKLFFRGDHMRPTQESDALPEKMGEDIEIRDVRLTRSKDFIHWSEPVVLDFGPDAVDYDLYTNNIMRYKRAGKMYLGMATRYVDRRDNMENIQYLPWFDDDSRMIYAGMGDRGATALTDAILMTSRDGVHFNRHDDVFLSPGLHDGSNWVYGDCYTSWPVCEIESDIPGEPKELVFYSWSGYRTRPVDVNRYTIRMDGFFSWHGGYKGGSLLTKPFTFEGNSMEINFATSALGYLRIKLCDETGNELAGYDSGNLFGDHIDRPVTFEKPLAALVGKPVRLKLEFKDAHLYSFKFNKD